MSWCFDYQNHFSDWAEHGICGRGVLLDLVGYFTAGGTKPLPYDPWTTHAITREELEACAEAQGVTFRRGDILLIRAGFMQRWYAAKQAERDMLQHNWKLYAAIYSLCMMRNINPGRCTAVLGLSNARRCAPSSGTITSPQLHQTSPRSRYFYLPLLHSAMCYLPAN